MKRCPKARALTPCLAVLLAASLACGKKGDPRPPLRPTPATITGLRLAQRGDQVEIRFTAPRASTDGAPLPVLDIELFVTQDAGDFAKVARARRFKAAPGEALTETEPLPTPGATLRAAARAIAKGHRGSLPEAARLLVIEPPSPPTSLLAQPVGEGMTLTWEGEVPTPLPTPTPAPTPEPATPPPATQPIATQPIATQPTAPTPPTTLPPPDSTPTPASPPTVAPTTGAERPPVLPRPTPTPTPTPEPFTPGFFIYRRSAAGAYTAPLSPTATVERTFVDRTAQPGESWCYTLRAVASADPLVESAASNEACVEMKDVLAPAAPAGVAAVVREHGLEVSWSPSPEADLLAYRIYRAGRGAFERVAEVSASETSFLDTQAPAGNVFRYRVTAVDRAGNESPRSAAVEARRP